MRRASRDPEIASPALYALLSSSETSSSRRQATLRAIIRRCTEPPNRSPTTSIMIDSPVAGPIPSNGRGSMAHSPRRGSSNVAAVFYSLVMTPLSERGTRPLTVRYGGEVVPSTHPGDVSIYVWSVRSEQRATIADGLAKGAGRCCSVERGDKAARTSVADPKSQSLRGRHRRPSDCTKLDTGAQAPRTTGRQRATLDLPHFTRPRVSEGQES